MGASPLGKRTRSAVALGKACSQAIGTCGWEKDSRTHAYVHAGAGGRARLPSVPGPKAYAHSGAFYCHCMPHTSQHKPGLAEYVSGLLLKLYLNFKLIFLIFYFELDGGCGIDAKRDATIGYLNLTSGFNLQS